MIRAVACVGFLVLGAAGAFGQTAAPAFDVASVKPADPASRRGAVFEVKGGSLTILDLRLKDIVREAYGVKFYQMSGGPAWMETDRFDIFAKVEGNPSKARVMEMLQTLLADRFQLKARRETKEGNVYALVVAKGGSKLKPSTETHSYVGLYRNTPMELPGVSYTIAGTKASMALFVQHLSEDGVRAPVLDRTGIQGEFDFKLGPYAIDDNPETGPSIFDAIREQLGLRLEATKGPVETLVIDHAEKPSGN